MASDALQFLTIPPSREVAEQALPAAVRVWFAAQFGAPTLAQRYAWPAIFNREHLLLSAPTGSGKTLAAFLPILTQIAAQPSRGLQCVYVAPLKALVRDVRANLRRAWRSLQHAGCFGDVELHIGVRTGDTAQRVRRQQLRHPPNILLTTPESLAQMLAHPATLQMLGSLRWVIVDEIHALVGNKRGADLALSLERLPEDIQRIGLSATCNPLAEVGRFLVGDLACTLAQVTDATEKQLVIEPLFENLDGSPAWLATLLDRLDGELAAERTTLIFTNTRNLAERLTWALRQRYPERSDEIAVHHSAISAARRRVVERRLKHGRLWLAVSSTSLELGIDIGSVDRVVFVHPPGGVARLLQRVGRSGHRPNEPRRGLLLTASPGELLESVVTASSGRDGHIEAVRTIDAPLDVLCQQLVSMAMTGWWSASEAFALVRRAAPYRELPWPAFSACLDYLSGRRADGSAWLPARLCWHGDTFTIADERTARLLRRNLGSILTEEACAIHLRAPTPEDQARTQTLGEVDLAYAERLQAGDRFMLDGRCLELKKRENASLVVDEVFGRPLAPRWHGNGVPMPVELARRIYVFRAHAGEMLRDGEDACRAWLCDDFHLNERAADVIVEYLLQQETVSEIPPLDALLIECVPMQSCVEYFVHTSLPRSANEALARVLLRRWHNINANALAANLGFYLLVHAAEPMTPDDWREGLHADGFEDELRASLADGELMRQYFASVAQTGLMVLRNPAGRKRKVGGKDWAERRLFEHLREHAANFVLLQQAEREVLETACDLATARAFAERLRTMPIRVRTLPEPSPLGESMLNGGFQTSTIAGTR